MVANPIFRFLTPFFPLDGVSPTLIANFLKPPSSTAAKISDRFFFIWKTTR